MTGEQAALLRRARTDLNLTKSEACDLTAYAAASRAYYSMFCAARALLLAENLDYSKHSAVIAAFGQHFAKTGRAPTHLHRYLIRGQETRLVADYQTMVQVTVRQAAELTSSATELLRLAEKTLGPIPDSDEGSS